MVLLSRNEGMESVAIRTRNILPVNKVEYLAETC